MNAPLIEPPGHDSVQAESEAFWQSVARDLVRQSFQSIDEVAKSLVTVAGIAIGLYFNGIAFSDIRGTSLSTLALVAYLGPLALMVLSIIFSLLTLLPVRSRLNMNSPLASKLTYERAATRKLFWLRVAAAFLVLGFTAVILAIGIYIRG